MNMVKLYDGGVYLVNGTEIVPEAAAPETYQKDTAKQGTIAYSILKAHNTAEDMPARRDRPRHRQQSENSFSR